VYNNASWAVTGGTIKTISINQSSTVILLGGNFSGITSSGAAVTFPQTSSNFSQSAAVAVLYDMSSSSLAPSYRQIGINANTLASSKNWVVTVSQSNYSIDTLNNSDGYFYISGTFNSAPVSVDNTSGFSNITSAPPGPLFSNSFPTGISAIDIEQNAYTQMTNNQTFIITNGNVSLSNNDSNTTANTQTTVTKSLVGQLTKIEVLLPTATANLINGSNTQPGLLVNFTSQLPANNAMNWSINYLEHIMGSNYTPPYYDRVTLTNNAEITMTLFRWDGDPQKLTDWYYSSFAVYVDSVTINPVTTEVRIWERPANPANFTDYFNCASEICFRY
jgi:hypothetical protein